MAEHSDLVSEINSVERMSTLDRLKHAKKRRAQQLKKFVQYEKQLEKDKNKRRKVGTAAAAASASKHPAKKARNVCFISDVMLLEAAARNDLDEVRKLLNEGVSPDAMNEDGLTALHQCCIDDLEAMMQLLVEFGANVNACDSELWTPLHAAATCGHVHLCKYLINHKAELLAVNADGNMPYDICEDELTLDFIESEMSKRGVTQEMIDETRLSTETRMLNDMKLLSEKGENLEYRGRNGETPLHIAGANGYVHVAEYLLNQHVAVDPVDDDLWQPIHAAACWGQLPVLELLVENGADLEAVTKAGETPLDICEDLDLKQRIIDMKDEIESHRATRKRDLVRKRSQNTRSSTVSGNSLSSIYNSNTSLGEKAAASASIRRTSMREKSQMHYKEAQEEAKMLRESADSIPLDDDDDDNDDKHSASNGIDENNKMADIPPATDVNDVKVNLPRDSLLVPSVVAPRPSPAITKKDIVTHRKKAVDSPALVKKSPAPVKKSPAPVKKSPAPVKKSPAPVKKSQAPDKKSPAPVKKSPAPVKKSPAPVKKAYMGNAINTADAKKPVATSDGKDKTTKTPQTMPSLDLPISQLAGSTSSPSAPTNGAQSNHTKPSVHANKMKQPSASSLSSTSGGATRGSTLADLKKQRAQKLHDSLRFRDTKLLNEQINSHNSMLVDGTTVGKGDEKTNGHNNGSLRNSVNSNLSNDSVLEPQKHRFTARASEVIGDDHQDDNACCTIL